MYTFKISKQVISEIIQQATTNNDIQVPEVIRRPKKMQKEVAAIQDTIQYMKTLKENPSNRNSFGVYGEHMAHKHGP